MKLLFIVEFLLIIYYLIYLVPNYNNILFDEPKLEGGSVPRCDMFVTQKEAQLFYNHYKESTTKIDNLDKDKDGIVCEDLR